MRQYVCDHCGASIEHSYNHKCPYCKSIIDFNEPQESTIEVKPEDLINIELISIHRDPFTEKIILMFSGYKCPMPKVYEYNSNNIYISRVENYINPPKCGFCIEIPLFEIRKYGISFIMNMIERTGVRSNELDKIKLQLIEKTLNYVI